MATTGSTFNTTTDNYYYEDYDDEICNTNGVNQFVAVFTPVFFSIVIILSLLGNILVIVILAKYENLKSLTNAFILNLAVSDLFFTAGLPFWAYSHMYGWTLGEHVCKIVNFVFYIGFYSSGCICLRCGQFNQNVMFLLRLFHFLLRSEKLRLTSVSQEEEKHLREDRKYTEQNNVFSDLIMQLFWEQYTVYIYI
uniref:G-protein coupled receptors family 1 profile domain-containing protein n=1 Tax=Sander lucioperca TaxID=283035 RepID=A0A8C9XCR0_SANLU